MHRRHRRRVRSSVCSPRWASSAAVIHRCAPKASPTRTHRARSRRCTCRASTSPTEPRFLECRSMLDRDQVLHVARLARLELSEAELEKMATELSKVLDHIDKIRELDLQDVPPTSHVIDIAGAVRPD